MSFDRDAFTAEITSYPQDQLIRLAASQYDRIHELELREAENERINTEVHLEYQKVCSERDSLREENLSLKAVLQKEIEKNTLLNRSVFGRRTEKFLDTLQGTESDAFIDEDQEEENGAAESRVIDPSALQAALQKHGHPEKKDDGQKKANGQAKKGHGKKAGQKNALQRSAGELPQELVYNFSVSELDEKYGEGNWRIAFWQETKTVEKLPLIYYQRTVYTPTISYGLEHCLENMPAPVRLFPHSLASPALLADILCRKYYLSLPITRQAQDYSRQSLMISKQVMIGWVNTLVPSVLVVVYEYLTQLLLKLKYTQNDETYIQVNKDGRSAGNKSFLWVHCSSSLLDCPPIIIFCYEKTRGTDHLRKFFREFSGYITCDAYISYQLLEQENPGIITAAGCMMHARRYFAIAFFIRPLDEMTDEQILDLPETKVLMKIREIYAAENRLKDCSAEERLAARRKDVAPKVDAFFEFIHELADSEEVFPERLQEAIRYSINQESHLRIFLTNGNIPIDNGHAERMISSYSVGRANWKFADTVRGAEVNAIMYSLVETAKANGADVEIYLRYLLEKIPPHLKTDGTLDDRSFLPELTPWSDVYRSFERMEKQRALIACRQMFPVPEKPRTPRKKKYA